MIVFVPYKGSTVSLQSQCPVQVTETYTGSASCRECHEKFYELWAPSHHGKAMQPFTPELAQHFLTPHTNDIVIGTRLFRTHFDESGGWISQTDTNGSTNYPIVHAMGGKNVFYFLTPRDRGRLQVLPLAYNVRTKTWYNSTASMVRHFSDGEEDEAVEWNDRLLTFNTACHDCHVSQMSKNYDPATDSYCTQWREPGINCETCHGPSSEHVRVCREAPEGTIPEDLKIILTSKMTHQELNDTCAPCHSKGMPIADNFMPKNNFFDHYDLTTIEDRDFYPDGRDLGENYTMTTWMMSRCVQADVLDCDHCHTSSGRFRFKDKPNQSCMPCHQDKVDNPSAHSHHADFPGSPSCVSCHMPMTTFAHMQRSDHSMRPPVPEATTEFGSPNACNICHTQNDTKCRSAAISKWHPDPTYRNATLHAGRLVKNARNNNWDLLPEILAYLKIPADQQTGDQQPETVDPVIQTSLIRLLANCPSNDKWPVLRLKTKDSSPLIRSAAAASLAYDPSPLATQALLNAVRDKIRLVRIRAAASLQQRPLHALTPDDLAVYQAALMEHKNSFLIWPDRWSSHYNLGLFYDRDGNQAKALASFEKATDLRPDVIPPLINASMLHARMNNTSKSKELLEKALKIDPAAPSANFNMALLNAESGNLSAAEKHFRAALTAEPHMAQAAYNLGILLIQQNKKMEGMELCRKATNLEPQSGRYAYTLAFYLAQNKKSEEAIGILLVAIENDPQFVDSYFFLANLYHQQSQPESARKIYRRILQNHELPLPARHRAKQMLQN